jgi:hypothetical protein
MEGVAMAISKVVLLVLLVLSGGCAAMTKWSAGVTWDAAESVCNTSHAECLRRCELNRRGTECEVLAIERVEKNDLSNADHGDIVALHELASGLCKKGVGRGCTADEKLRAHALFRDPSAPAETETAATSTDRGKKVAELLERSEAARRMAKGAVDASGDREAKDVAIGFASCKAPRCEESLEATEERSPIGAYAGLALYLLRDVSVKSNTDWLLALEPDIEKAEGAARRAQQEYEKADKTRRADLAAAQEEEPAYTKAMEQCATTRPACAKKCADGDTMVCLGLGLVWANATPPDWVQAIRLVGQACENGSKAACLKSSEIGAANLKYNKEVDGKWSDVEQIADDLAQKKFLAAFAASNFSGRRNAAATARMQQHIQAITTEAYCPAKREFVAAAGQLAFTTRAKKHCETNPPSATGASGTEVELKTECAAVHATPCPGR